MLTSFGDFLRVYGGREDLTFDGTAMTNYMAHGVRAFFEEGAARVRDRVTGDGGAASAADVDNLHLAGPSWAPPLTCR